MKVKHSKRKNKNEKKEIGSSANWQSIAVDTSAISADEFASFGGIEVLTDYELIRPDKNEEIVTISLKNEAEPKKKKLKRDTVQENDDQCIADDTVKSNLNSLKMRKKKRKKPQHLKHNEETSSADTNFSEFLKNENSPKGDSKDVDMSLWCNCFVPEPILLALKDLKFDKPTPIQELTLPPAIRDYQDILGAAETGSGKTLAFGIPIVAHILASKEKELNTVSESMDTEDNLCVYSESQSSGRPLRALVLTPTRELAIQVKNHLLAIVKYTDIKVAAVVGGMSSDKQRRILSKCPDIVVATPGRLWELMEEGDPHLNQAPNISYLVIDEADRMVEKGHFAELTDILHLINGGHTRKRRQTFVFSATLTLVHDLPKRMVLKKRKVKMEQKQKLGALIELIGMKEMPKVIDITGKTGVVETLTESQITCSMEEKDSYLYYFLRSYPGRTLVFCNSIDCVRRLKNVLELLGLNPLPLHASMQQRQRLKNLDRFTASKTGLLLASDVAARGLDINGIEHVVHFQVPRTSEVYIHRSGRTARASKEGLSLVLMSPEEGIFAKKIFKDKVLPAFPVTHNVFKMVKERVTLARLIDQKDHRVQRLAAQNRWFIKAAKDMELDIEDEGLLHNQGKDDVQVVREVRNLKKQLKILLAKQILPKDIVGRYPTKSGKLLKIPKCGEEKALFRLKKNKVVKKRLFFD